MPSAARVAASGVLADMSAAGTASTRNAAAPSASVAATATTRRDADTAASSGISTSQMAAIEWMPPEYAATVVAMPVSASAETTWALS